MDDGVIVYKDKEHLKKLLCEMNKLADELKLSFNEKTQIFPLKQGVDFLGFHFYLTDSGKVIRRLRTSNKKRWKRRLQKFRKEYARGNMSMEEILRSLNIYSGHLKHGNTYRLQQHVYSKCFFKTDKASTEITKGKEK